MKGSEIERTNGEDALKILMLENLGTLCEESHRVGVSMQDIITDCVLPRYIFEGEMEIWGGGTEIYSTLTFLLNLNIFTDLII